LLKKKKRETSSFPPSILPYLLLLGVLSAQAEGDGRAPGELDTHDRSELVKISEANLGHGVLDRLGKEGGREGGRGGREGNELE